MNFKKYEEQNIIKQINNLEEEISKLSNEELFNKTKYFKELLKHKSLDDILPEAFAVVRESAKRTIGMRPYDVQLLGAIAIHKGKIAEMQTGEGKTLAAVPAAYLNALHGKGVHIITINEYLAKRDKKQMEKIFNFLGMTTRFDL